MQITLPRKAQWLANETIQLFTTVPPLGWRIRPIMYDEIIRRSQDEIRRSPLSEHRILLNSPVHSICPRTVKPKSMQRRRYVSQARAATCRNPMFMRWMFVYPVW